MYIERKLENQIKEQLKLNKIIAVIGPRQVGKTTLTKKIFSDFKGTKKFITFDDVKELELFEKDLDSFIQKNVEKYDLLLIDEIQYSKDSGKKLKFIYDNFKTKIIITGSSSPEITLQSSKYLVGRIIVNNLFSFSFEETILAKKKEYYEIYKKNNYKLPVIRELNKLLEEHIIFGGYPEIVLQEEEKNKKLLLNNLINTFINREVKDILQIENSITLNNLLKLLSHQTTNLVVESSVGAEASITNYQLKNFLKVLQLTYTINLLKPFFNNKRKELTKTPKVYFYDTGFRNAVIKDFSLQNKGALYENFVFLELIKAGFEPKFWRTKSKAEVDFVIEHENNLIAIEVKAKKDPLIGKSFFSFLEKYKPKMAIIVSMQKEETRKTPDGIIYFVPFVKLTSFLENEKFK